MNKIYAPYLIYKDKDGYYKETKYNSEIDFDVLEKNSGIIENFYNEPVKVEAINDFRNNNFILIKDNKPLEVSKEFVLNNLRNLFIEILKEFSKSKYIDYKKDDDFISFKEQISKILINFNEQIDLNNINYFNENNYLNKVKEISLYTSLSFPLEYKMENLYSKQIKVVIKSLNTILAVNEEIKVDPENASEKYFNLTVKNDENGDFKKVFKYSNLIDIKDNNVFQYLEKNMKKNKLSLK